MQHLLFKMWKQVLVIRYQQCSFSVPHPSDSSLALLSKRIQLWLLERSPTYLLKNMKLLYHCQQNGKTLSVCVLFQTTCIISPEEDYRNGCACQELLYWTDNLYASPPPTGKLRERRLSFFLSRLSKVFVFALFLSLWYLSLRCTFADVKKGRWKASTHSSETFPLP